MTDTTTASPRASDADRDRYADLLRERTASGQLTVDQFAHRVDAAYTATTLAELDRLLADLPATDHGPQDLQVARQPVPSRRYGSQVACLRGIPVECVLIALVIVLIALLG